VLSAPSPSRRYARLRDKMVDDACMNVASRTLVQSGAPLVEIGDPFKLEVVADLLSTDAPQIEKGAAVRIDGRGGTALQVTRVDPAGFLKVSAPGIEEQRVRVTICDGGVRDAPAAARRDRPAGPKGLVGNPSHSLPNNASAALAGDRIATPFCCGA
jgi:HlyD family secretion protein